MKHKFLKKIMNRNFNFTHNFKQEIHRYTRQNTQHFIQQHNLKIHEKIKLEHHL